MNTPTAPAPVTTLTPPAPGEYWPDQGGHYICTLAPVLDMPARHLIASAVDSLPMAYGPYTDTPGAASHVNGAANTTALLAAALNNPAAKWAQAYTADGHTDFFLPARLDLMMAYICAPQLFKKDWYWTSTQYDRGYAFCQSFELGNSYWYIKGNEVRVRACRVIHL